MDNPRIIHAPINIGRRYAVTTPITQYDYGYLLLPEGVELPTTYEIDFSNDEKHGTSLIVYGDSEGAEVPEELIRTGKDVYAFYYHVGDGYGKTEFTWRLPNKCRPSRDGQTPTPSQQSSIDQLIVRSNEAVESAEQSASDASASAQSAQGYAEQAEDARDTAQGYANNAQTSANNASASASQASTSATASAQSASQSAQIKADVEDLVEQAQGYAQASAQSASASANSASQAHGYAQSASASAQSASGYASSAQASANTASTSAQTASTKASEASQSASQALSYKTDAESAKTASQTAQGLAESARDSAIQAKTDAEQAKADAESARDSAIQAKNDAESAVASISGALDDKADIITDTASGAIASFSDGADDLPLKSLIVDINPVQDLHGYDSPWPAGGGVNQWDEEWELGVWDATGAKVNNDNAIRSKGYIPVSPETEYYLHLGTRYTVGLIIRVLDSNKSFVSTITFSNSMAFTIPAGGAFIVICTYASNNITDYNNDIAINYPSTVTTYSPYENICPISGWTEVGVEQRGKNLLDLSILRQGDWDNTTRANNVAFDEYLPIQANVTYAWSSTIPSINGRYLRFYDSDKQYISSVSLYDVGTKTFTTPSNAAFYRAMWYRTSAITPSDITEDQIQVGTTATPYEPYTGRSITISLGQTVYGGKLDVLTGELVVDRAIVDLGTLTWGRHGSVNTIFSSVIVGMKLPQVFTERNTGIISSEYAADSQFSISDSMHNMTMLRYNNNGSSVLFIRDMRYTDGNDFKAAVSGVQLCYELATPQTYQLTPTEVATLLGDNTIWADTGDTTAEYRADTELWVQRKIAEAIASLT